jgi:ssDNA-binding Zn-finger/Zn-ribbon topoisomerase 1
MLTASGICTCNRCERFGKREIYRMVGRCYNCQADPVLMLYRSGDRACPLDCPKCGNYQSVRPSRLATDDEIPAAEATLCVSCGREPGTYENCRGQLLCSGCADGTSPEGAAAVARSVAELGDPS